jgi:hypothetical protein|tara:strand:- start:142 stop:552 length:411 start_codon:yes stop_codon:yes gene_type:complete
LSINYRQLKLANGEELIADVIQWANDEDASIVIRSALKLVMTERDDGIRLYALRPWMIYCEDMNHLLTINADQIVGETIPSNPLLSQYTLTVAEFIKSHDEEHKDEEDIDVTKLSTMLDSDGSSNVLSLFPNNTMH